jgi:hypothetical protein
VTDRIADGLEWLATEISATREEFRIAQGDDGDELLDGLVSQGYVRHGQGRFQVSDEGFARVGSQP